MISTKKERELLTNSLMALYENSVSIPAREAPLGSFVIAKFEEDNSDFEKESSGPMIDYIPCIIYRHSKMVTRAAFLREDLYLMDDNLTLKPDQLVVVLNAVPIYPKKEASNGQETQSA